MDGQEIRSLVAVGQFLEILSGFWWETSDLAGVEIMVAADGGEGPFTENRHALRVAGPSHGIAEKDDLVRVLEGLEGGL